MVKATDLKSSSFTFKVENIWNIRRQYKGQNIQNIDGNVCSAEKKENSSKVGLPDPGRTSQKRLYSRRKGKIEWGLRQEFETQRSLRNSALYACGRGSRTEDWGGGDNEAATVMTVGRR